MPDLGFYEHATLELVAESAEHTVLDRSTLVGLHDKGLVELARDGWSLTPLGERAIGASGEVC